MIIHPITYVIRVIVVGDFTVGLMEIKVGEGNSRVVLVVTIEG